MVVVKAAPVLTPDLEEAMCVAGVSIGSEPEWIRLFPVPFRDLQDDKKFRKYQVLNLSAVRPRSDRRPESWTPIEGRLQLGRTLGTAHDWSERRELIGHLNEQTMCDLVAANVSGSGPGVPSLGVVRPAARPTLEITERDPGQIKRWKELAEAEAAKVSLFDEPGTAKTPLEAVPWRFRYRYTCRSADCAGHAQTIVDWELVALWRKVRDRSEWQDLIRSRYVDDMWAGDRDTVLFVGNQVKWPSGFLVLGVFWPPGSALQTTLDF